METVVGLDLSLTGAGVGVLDYDMADNTMLPAVYTFGRGGHKADTYAERYERIEELTLEIENVVRRLEWVPRLVAIEEMPYGATSTSAFDRAGLWWSVYRMLDRQGIAVLGVNVAKVKRYALGKGSGKGTDKDQVMAAAIRRYPEVPISNNNESDAWILTMIASRMIGEPYEKDLPATHTAALEGLVLP